MESQPKPPEPSTCDGDCCVSFALPFDWLQLVKGEVDGMDADEARLLSLIFEPITPFQANSRQRVFVNGDKQTFTDDQHTYKCKMWDTMTRKCLIYKHRPAGCRDFPYGAQCRYGCNECGCKPAPDVII